MSDAALTATFYHDIEQDVNVPSDREACRDAVRGLLAIEADLDVRTTYNVVGSLWREQPEIVEWIRAGGHEVAFHSFRHTYECPPDEFATEVALCRDFSAEPVGYRSPRSRWNQDTLDSLEVHGFEWTAESDPAPSPYLIRDQLVRLPIAGDDWPIHTGRLDLPGWVDRFRAKLEGRPYVAVGVHDCVVSHDPRPRLEAWRRCLEMAAEAGAAIQPFGTVARMLLG